jgi:ribosomal protein S18 acetylase RimI-like enzyme
MNETITIRATVSEDIPFIKELMDKHWGGEPLVIRGKNYFPSALPGLIAFQHSEVLGFLFYEIQNGECEIVVLEVFDKFKGLGTELIEKLKIIAREQDCSKLHLMTTNDNMDALRFYQRRGFYICGIHLNSIEASRRMKPAIGMTGDHGIPLRDEIDLEMLLN